MLAPFAPSRVRRRRPFLRWAETILSWTRGEEAFAGATPPRRATRISIGDAAYVLVAAEERAAQVRGYVVELEGGSAVLGAPEESAVLRDRLEVSVAGRRVDGGLVRVPVDQLPPVPPEGVSALPRVPLDNKRLDIFL